METPEDAQLVLHQVEDPLEAPSGHVAAGIEEFLFVQMVQSVIEEKELSRRETGLLKRQRRLLRREGDFGRRERHFSTAWRNWMMTYGMPLKKRDSSWKDRSCFLKIP